MSTSVMPKGVEHELKADLSKVAFMMSTSVMLKGVEHETGVLTASAMVECPPL